MRRSHERRPRLRPIAAAAAAAGLSVLVAACVGAASPRAASDAQGDGGCAALGRGRPPDRIATAKLIVEYNATDEDIGVHGAFDDDGWSRLCVFDPRGRPVLDVSPKSQLEDLTMAGIFFESREPPRRQLDFADLKARFPEGRYEVRGLTYDGKVLVGSALFTHDVPRKPRVTSPRDGARVDRRNANVTWDDVTRTLEGRPVKVTGYQVIVTKEQRDDPHGFSRPIYDVHLPPNRNKLEVPAEFLQPGTEYELEVLALEKSGNQTIAVSFFRTR